MRIAKRIALWGFPAAGLLFLFAGAVRYLRTDAASPFFFVVGAACLLVGLILAGRERAQH